MERFLCVDMRHDSSTTLFYRSAFSLSSEGTNRFFIAFFGPRFCLGEIEKTIFSALGFPTGRVYRRVTEMLAQKTAKVATEKQVLWNQIKKKLSFINRADMAKPIKRTPHNTFQSCLRREIWRGGDGRRRMFRPRFSFSGENGKLLQPFQLHK